MSQEKCVKEKIHRKNSLDDRKNAKDVGNSACLGCGEHLAYCGKPFSDEIECRNCGAVNVFVESQQPKFIREEAGTASAIPAKG